MGWPTGFWWSELTHAYWAFTEAGYDLLSLGFKKSPAHTQLLEKTPSVRDLDLKP